MISYLQLERTAAGEIRSGDAVLFDNAPASGGDQISYNTSTGEVVFGQAGYYYIDWFVAPQFGLTTDGSNFAVVTSEDDPPMTGSSHVRVSPTIGFAVIDVTTPGKTVRLINTSNGSIMLSQAVNIKAGLAVFSIAGPDAALE